mgnify:CR=1 FL=1
MTDFILILFLLLVVGAAAFYVIRAKRQGRKCIGCPYAKDLPGGTCPCHAKQQ